MTSSTRLSYITGLDGIRAVAVMAVLFYHANIPWALGVFWAWKRSLSFPDS
jgi:peptidoglycan/LPS O-acetylase OafA/YrhL